MERGADARSGIWPYRGDTGAAAMATERGYDEIVEIVREEERKREKAARGAETLEPAMEPAADAVARGDAAWLRERHREGTLRDPVSGDGLLTLAVKHDRPEILELLLELGFDPDENRREAGEDETVRSWGRPLQECTRANRLAMAEMLLARGADANAWACVWNAYRRKDAAMIELLGALRRRAQRDDARLPA